MSTAEKLETANEQIVTLSAKIAKNAETPATTTVNPDFEHLEESAASSVPPEVFVSPVSSSPAHLILCPFCFEFAPLDVIKFRDSRLNFPTASKPILDLSFHTVPLGTILGNSPFTLPLVARFPEVVSHTAIEENQIPLGRRPTQEHAKAHTAIRDRQVLIDPDRDHPILNETTKRETAIDLIRQAIEAVDRVDGPEIQLKSIAQLRNNGVLLEFNSQEAAAWIRKVPNRITFLEKLGGTTTIKDRVYSVPAHQITITHVEPDVGPSN
ncbi:hypothetical protein M404DRAFT_33801 [Pisolithus tinctorius Marx 270]|uniref:Uncharacterized protein n=1 Tax=Pisolithus tinctorius Marx 270 TaxID=870435 RepID=A0A0C3IFR8_PISTI|nr:hypothetical protein M404DRAFT_33798 [Pisolithus tinctorius Marx 270]KIN95838.1 hypothetical protein M404DRAFT_33801 [Pisolithus tinctorius Marx 270]